MLEMSNYQPLAAAENINFVDIYRHIQSFLPRKEILRVCLCSSEWFEGGARALFDQLFLSKKDNFFSRKVEECDFKKWENQLTPIENWLKINRFFNFCLDEVRESVPMQFSEENWERTCPSGYHGCADFSELNKIEAENNQTLVDFFSNFMSEQSLDVQIFLSGIQNQPFLKKVESIQHWLANPPQNFRLDFHPLVNQPPADWPSIPAEALALVLVDDHRRTLKSSAIKGNFRTFTEMLERDFNQNQLGEPLKYASEWGQVDLVRFILANVKNCNISREFFGEAVGLASREGQLKVLDLLMNCNRFNHPEKLQDYLHAAFENAIQGEHLEVISMLATHRHFEQLKRGNDVRLLRKGLVLAVREGRKDILEIFESFYCINFAKSGQFAGKLFVEAVRARRVEILELMASNLRDKISEEASLDALEIAILDGNLLAVLLMKKYLLIQELFQTKKAKLDILLNLAKNNQEEQIVEIIEMVYREEAPCCDCTNCVVS